MHFLETVNGNLELIISGLISFVGVLFFQRGLRVSYI